MHMKYNCQTFREIIYRKVELGKATMTVTHAFQRMMAQTNKKQS